MSREKIDHLGRTRLGPLILHVANTTGAVSELVERLEERTGITFARQEVEKWVAWDPDKWVHPRLGIGQVLVEVGTEMIKDDQKKKRRAERALSPK